MNRNPPNVQSLIASLRSHAASMHGPNHDTARYAASALETLFSSATRVVKSVDNWRNVQPVNPQIMQDIEVLRSTLESMELK